MLKSTATNAVRRGRGRRTAHRACAGFTFVELVITLGIMLVVCAMAVPALADAIKAARAARAVADVRTIGDAAYGFYMETGAAPASLNEIGYNQQIDPWGHPYRYLPISPSTASSQRTDRFGVPINKLFDLYSQGPDGQSGTSLDDAPSQDDVIWANDSMYVGLSLNY